MLVFIASCATAVIVSFLCSLMEAVLLSLNPLRLQTLQRQGHKHAAIWLGMKRNIHRPVAAILILNTVAHTGGATIAGGAFDEVYGAQWLWVFSAVFTVVILVGTEIIPKLIGVACSERLAPWIGVPLAMLTTFLRPTTRTRTTPLHRVGSNGWCPTSRTPRMLSSCALSHRAQGRR